MGQIFNIFLNLDLLVAMFAAINFSCFFRDDFNIKVLHAFVELHEFTDLNLVQALR